MEGGDDGRPHPDTPQPGWAWPPCGAAGPCWGASARPSSRAPSGGLDSVSLFCSQRSQTPHPLLPAQPLVLQLAEHLLLQPQPQPQLRQLQHQPQPQPDSQPPQPLPQPQPQPQLQQPQQLGERRLLSLHLQHPAPGRSPLPPRLGVPLPMPPAPPKGTGTGGEVENSRGLLRMDLAAGESGG